MPQSTGANVFRGSSTDLPRPPVSRARHGFENIILLWALVTSFRQIGLTVRMERSLSSSGNRNIVAIPANRGLFWRPLPPESSPPSLRQNLQEENVRNEELGLDCRMTLTAS
jgi:hypothetical protein